VSKAPNPSELEQPPASRRARLARSLRFLRRVPGWPRIAGGLVPAAARGSFVAINDGVVFAGDLASHLDRHVYLFGGYEQEEIALFLSRVARERRGLVLDVGANVGVHSLAFAGAFREVHAFEPNPALWDAFERNRALNGFENVRLHRLGLADRDATLTLRLIDKPNLGLGTFSTIEQYDLPLKAAADCRVAAGDAYIEKEGLGRVDAIKIDVQGFEPEVLRGLRGVLARDRPLVWFELGIATAAQLATRADIERLFPYPVEVLRMSDEGFPRRVLRLRACPATPPPGDYLALPT
jgi:FkbM family methyltransferase